MYADNATYKLELRNSRWIDVKIIFNRFSNRIQKRLEYKFSNNSSPYSTIRKIIGLKFTPGVEMLLNRTIWKKYIIPEILTRF